MFFVNIFNDTLTYEQMLLYSTTTKNHIITYCRCRKERKVCITLHEEWDPCSKYTLVNAQCEANTYLSCQYMLNIYRINAETGILYLSGNTYMQSISNC